MNVKRLLSLTLCLGMIGSVSLPAASAVEENPQHETADVALSEAVIRDGGTTELPAFAVPYMGTATVLYTMTTTNLLRGEKVTTMGRQYFLASYFPRKAGEIHTNFTSNDTSNTVRVGLCYVDRYGDYQADVVVTPKANGRESHYVYTNNMDPDLTYYGFISNSDAFSAVSGTAQICRMD